MNLQAVTDHIIVEQDPIDKMTSGGLLLPDGHAYPYVSGTVLSIGKGYLLKDGTYKSLSVIPGDRVLFCKNWGEPVQGEDNIRILNEHHIYGILTEVENEEV